MSRLAGGEAHETVDSICGLTLVQTREGYRFNMDPIFLAHFAAAAAARGKAIDLGTGSGIIPLILVRKLGQSDATGLELQRSLFELAERNVRLNHAEHQVAVVQGDLRRVQGLLPAQSYAQVICNPPYRIAGSGRVNPNPEKAIARHELACDIDDVVRAAQHLLADGAGLCVIFPAARLEQLFASLRSEGFQPKRLRFIHARVDQAASRVMVEARRGKVPEALVEPPLVVHRSDASGFSEEVEHMLAGPPPH